MLTVSAALVGVGWGGGVNQATFDNLTVFIQLERTEETRNGGEKGRLAWDHVCHFKHFTLLSSLF